MDQVTPAGMTDPLILGEIFQRFESRFPTPSESEFLLTAYLDFLHAELSIDSDFRLMPHMPSIVETLSADPRYQLGIATGNIRGAANAKLEKAGMEQYFQFGGYGCDHATREGLVKAGIRRASELLDREVLPKEVVVIGDTPRDVESALANGAWAVGVATGSSYGVEALKASGAHAALDDLSLLPEWLDATVA